MDREKVGICGSSAKMNEIMLFAGEGTELTRVLSETSQNQRQALCVSLICGIWGIKEKQVKWRVFRIWMGEGREYEGSVRNEHIYKFYAFI